MMELLLAAAVVYVLQSICSATITFYALVPLVIFSIVRRLKYGTVLFFTCFFSYLAWQHAALFNGMRVLLNEGIVAAAKWGTLLPLQQTGSTDATIVVSIFLLIAFRTYNGRTVVITVIAATLLPIFVHAAYPLLAYALLFMICFIAYMTVNKRRVSMSVLTIIGAVTLAATVTPSLQPFSTVGDFITDRKQYIQYGEQRRTMLTNGDFTNIEPFTKTATPAFTLTMNNPRPLYLKSYVGSAYNNGWVVQRDDALPYVQIDEALQSFPYTQYAVASDAEETTVVIEPLNMSKQQLLTPYELASVPAHASATNGTFYTTSLFGEASYTYRISTTSYANYRAVASTLYSDVADDYLQQEAWHNYRSYGQYTAIPQHVRTLLLNHFELPAHTSYEESIAFVEQQMNVISYNEQVTMHSKDNLAHLLEQSREGYSVHYATLATLLFRAMNIPARYVEGYIVTNDDLTGAQTMTISSDARHAWPEIYIDYIGWMPVEVTPGYAQKMPPLQEATHIATNAPQTTAAPQATTSAAPSEVKQPHLEETPTNEQTKTTTAWWPLIALLALPLAFVAWRRYKYYTRIDVRFMTFIHRFNKRTKQAYKTHEAIQAMQLPDATALYTLYNEHIYSGKPLTKQQQQHFQTLLKAVKKQVNTR